ncbi:hypothetical protein KUCAC02_014416 [Chaenocephalus aceratus]|uniref:Uncharacterized protein n=1 Tax=Chaenocephalus aceratus TaxID=36190 RepID=A0ACB9WDR8_CHAAC|nr:hypothetical protein KUCAC02_014416 [Chaenocephalus aceratus]
MRKRRCNPPWDHMNKSDYHPVLLSMQGEGCEDHCYSVLNATNALDVGPETRLPGRALSIASPSCQQQPNGLSICDF